MMLQVGGALPTTPLELLLISSVETKVVLAILLSALPENFPCQTPRALPC